MKTAQEQENEGAEGRTNFTLEVGGLERTPLPWFKVGFDGAPTSTFKESSVFISQSEITDLLRPIKCLAQHSLCEY